MTCRPFQLTCHCRAYEFPHRLGGGRCHGLAWADAYYLLIHNPCPTCNANAGGCCEVASGQEALAECKGYQESLHLEHDPHLPQTEEEFFLHHQEYNDHGY